MSRKAIAAARRIILLYNMDSSWTRAEQREVRRLAEKMLAGLERQKYSVQPVEVYGDLQELEAYDPLEWLVFNWCEGFEGLSWSENLVAKELETYFFRATKYPGRSAQRIPQEFFLTVLNLFFIMAI